MGDEGFAQSDAAELLRFRRNIGADHVKIFTGAMIKSICFFDKLRASIAYVIL
jgi:hypothetical protein